MSPADVHALAVAAGLDHEAAVVATAVAWGESGLRADAVGDSALADGTWGPSIGLWQIRSLRSQAGTGAGRDATRLAEPAFNAASMAAISRRGTDWSPWTVWHNLSYRSHLEDVRAALGPTMKGWMPGAIRTPPRGRAGLAWVDATAWKLLLHTTESDYRRNAGGRENYHGHQGYPHFEVSEEAIEQYLPITVGAYALAAATDTYGYGNAAHAVQVEIVWNAAKAPDMSEPLLANIAAVLTFLRRETDMAPNLPPQGFPSRISTGNWFSRQGWYDHEGLAGHGNVPGNFDRWDPGPLPARRIVALSDAAMDIPAPAPAPTPAPRDPTKEPVMFERQGVVYLTTPVWTGTDVTVRRTSWGLPGYWVKALGGEVADLSAEEAEQFFADTDPAQGL